MGINRAAAREALRDQLATVRVLTAALREILTVAERRKLSAARADALEEVRHLLRLLHPNKRRPRRKKARP